MAYTTRESLPVSGRQEALGIGLGVIGNLLNAVGYVLQKKGWNSKKPTERIWQRGTWVVDFLAYAAGSVVFAVALGFATASMLLPLGGLKLAAFAALAPCVLGEKIGLCERRLGQCVRSTADGAEGEPT